MPKPCKIHNTFGCSRCDYRESLGPQEKKALEAVERKFKKELSLIEMFEQAMWVALEKKIVDIIHKELKKEKDNAI